MGSTLKRTAMAYFKTV